MRLAKCLLMRNVMTNWKAMQVIHKVDGKKQGVRSVGVNPRYMSMGSFHASLSKEGQSRKIFKGQGTKIK